MDITDIITIKICTDFYDNFKRLPKQDEFYKGFNLGNFIFQLKNGRYPHLKDKIECIFHTELKYFSKQYLTDHELISRCQKFYDKYKRFPKSGEKIDGWNISAFMDGIKRGRHSNIKPILEGIFNKPIEVSCKLQRYNTPTLIAKCKEFYNEFGRLPHQKEIYKGWKIGIFIHGLKYRKDQSYKRIFEDIFNEKIEIHHKITDHEVLLYCKEFYNIYHRLPVRSDVYKGWNIGTYVHGLKNGSNGHMKKAIEDIFEQEIDFNYKVFKMNDDEIFDMCKKFYEEFKRLPEINESYKGWRIGLFIQEIRDGKHQLIKNIVSDIFENLI